MEKNLILILGAILVFSGICAAVVLAPKPPQYPSAQNVSNSFYIKTLPVYSFTAAGLIQNIDSLAAITGGLRLPDIDSQFPLFQYKLLNPGEAK